jgi:hypothetical protein
MSDKKYKKVTTGVVFPERLLIWLRLQSIANDTSVSYIVKLAVEEYMKKLERKERKK